MVDEVTTAPDDRLFRLARLLLLLFLIVETSDVWSSDVNVATRRIQQQDPALNHFVDPPGYQTAPLGMLGRIDRDGSGRQPLILIPGLGFGSEEFHGFLGKHEDKFDIYRITLPGFGGTSAPPSPPENISFGQQTWTNAVTDRIEGLIADNDLYKPIIIGHWITGSQIALRLGLRKPESVGAVILLAGTARYEPTPPDTSNGAGPSIEERIEAIDTYVAPQWFKSITRETWDDNNFLPGDYVANPVIGLRLWRIAARPPLHVWVRYLCEFYAQDVTKDLNSLKVPTLLIQPGLEGTYQEKGLEYLDAYLHTSWSRSGGDQFVTIARISNTRIMMWHDNPQAVESEIMQFLSSVNLIE